LIENGNKANLDKVLLDGLPASQIHDGGRLKFGPEGMLYVTNGDSSNPSRAQDLKRLSGKIFRIQRYPDQ
jgi:glucose/arabinose dehydrogenase